MTMQTKTMVNRLPLTKARVNLGALIRRVHNNKEHFILERIAQTSHLTLHGLKDELAARGVNVSHNAVWLFLRREGLSFKKNTVRPRAGA